MSQRVLVIDNYDSFTYNLVQYLQSLGAVCDVWLSDQISADAALAVGADGILLSPGPGTPNEAGVTLELIERSRGSVPVLGVCLGHQAIGQAFGATIVRAERLMHGKTSPVLHDGRGIFQGIPSPVIATRYHSLLIDPPTLPDCLEVTARTAEGEIMAVSHRQLPITGVQFHPESILTEHGLQMIENWLSGIGRKGKAA
jgi:para-aminobenzoate synthetase component 2